MRRVGVGGGEWGGGGLNFRGMICAIIASGCKCLQNPANLIQRQLQHISDGSLLEKSLFFHSILGSFD